MVIGDSQYGLAKTKYLVNLAALCDESTGSMDEGRTENVFVFTEVFCKIFHLSLEKLVRCELVK